MLPGRAEPSVDEDDAPAEIVRLVITVFDPQYLVTLGCCLLLPERIAVGIIKIFRFTLPGRRLV